MQHSDDKKNKGFFKRNKNLAIAGVIALLLVIGVLFGIRLWTQSRFILDKGLIVYVSPGEKSLSLHYGEKEKVSFGISAENPQFCTASCIYKFIDNSQKIVLDTGEFNISNTEMKPKSYEISVNKFGTGQDLYNFEVMCKNKRTFFCPAEKQGGEVFRSSLVIVNYELSEMQKGLKETLKGNVTKFLAGLAEADRALQELNQRMFDAAADVNFGNLTPRKIALNDKFDQLAISAENLRGVWASQDYVELNKLFNESFFDSLNAAKSEIGLLQAELNSTIIKHNSVVMLAREYSDNYDKINYLSKTPILKSHSILDEAAGISDEFNVLIIALKDKAFKDYGELEGKAEELLSRQKKQLEIINNLSLPAVLDGEHLLKSEKDLLCLIRNCSDAITVEPVLKRAGLLYSGKKLAEPEILGNVCGKLKEAAKEFAASKENSIIRIKEKNITFPNSAEFKEYIASRLDNLTTARDNSYFDSLLEIKNQNLSDPFIVGSYSSILPPKRASGFIPNPNFEMLNLTLYHLSALSPAEKTDIYLNRTCANTGVPALPKLYSYEYRAVPANSTYNISSQIVTELSDNPPICCVFGECNPCCSDESCRNDPSSFPIILLHGHAVSGDSSVEYSLDAYNKVQHKLQEDGYINAGILSLYNIREDVKEGEWGISGRPVTVKVSYYYDAFKKGEKYVVVPTKSETIDTYAVRLKDIVESVKRRTGKPKANIIANSMGGLVARRYMQIFGDASVYKLIMTGTPNKGIVGNVRDVCGIIGEDLECRDMQENSLFINVLNDPARQPSNVKIYIIAGSGCEMDGKDGDGIVLLDHAIMPNAKPFVVKAKEPCSFGSYLHTKLLDTDKYPEVYKAIKETLKE